MEFFDISMTVAIGLLLRFGTPVLLTVLLILGLSKLDKHWQAEAQKQLAVVGARNIGCWEINECAPDKRKGCQAYQQPDKPCWQVFRESSGILKERCLACKVFREAPLPA